MRVVSKEAAHSFHIFPALVERVSHEVHRLQLTDNLSFAVFLVFREGAGVGMLHGFVQSRCCEYSRFYGLRNSFSSEWVDQTGRVPYKDSPTLYNILSAFDGKPRRRIR